VNVLKNVEDLIASAKSVYTRYSASRMERETVREWVLGLSGYPAPYDGAIREAMAWFKPLQPDVSPDELKVSDLDYLQTIFENEGRNAQTKTRP
jgi:hypothetical protein